jgi:hypothetical protein
MKAVYVFICLLTVVSAQCQSPDPHSWSQEPNSFLGITLGMPLRTSVVECPRVTAYGSTRYEWVGFGRPCFEPMRNFYEIYNISPFFDIIATEIKGNVEHVGAKFNNGNAASLASIDASGIAAALADKFGAAHYHRTEVVHSKAGAAYENNLLFWKGKNIEIDFESVAGEYNHGYVCAYTVAYVADSSRRQGQSRDAVKGVL